MKNAFWLCVVAFLCPAVGLAQVNVVPPNPLPPELPQAQAEQEGVETLTRGPIHEAFANPAEPDPEPNRIVPQQPPADVPEQPAAYRPEGDYEWISGYWEWDDDRDEYLWVTGVWRQPPPNMRWVPGYWNEVEGGWQRVEGFWVGDEVENVTYYDQPPATIESGPSSPAPADNYFWIPGAWNYGNSGYAWQGGYWAPYQQNWVWVPTRWVWTPAGFVYLPGHWDYRMGDRGQIFAPVAFRTTVYTQPGYFYRPTVVIPTDNLFIYLWVRPRTGCYYFGNYFGAQYADRGFVSSARFGSHHHHHHRHRHHYDPFYTYSQVHYRRQGVDFVGRVQGWHRYYDEHPDHRPARTWHEQHEHDRTRKLTGAAVSTQLTARTISEAARKGDTNFKLRQIDDRELQAQLQRSKKIRELDDARRRIERDNAQVSTRTPRPGNDPRDRDRDRDQGKTGSLVDRIEKGDRSEKGDRGEKVDRTDKGGRPEIADRGDKTDKGDKGDKSDRTDRSEKGDRGDKGREPGSIARDGQSPKLTLPKMDLPRTPGTARTPDGQARESSGQRGKAPPLPTATRRPNPSDDRTPGAPRPTPGADITRGTDRLPPGKGPGNTSKVTERRDDPPTVRRETGRTPSFDPPDNDSSKGKSRGDTPNIPGNDLPRIPQPNRNNDGPRLDQPPRPADQPRSNDVPGVKPPRPAADPPKVEVPNRSPDVPRVNTPNRGNENRGNNAPPSDNRSKSPPPQTNQRNSSAPPKIEAPKSAPRPERPAVRNPQPQPQPQPQPRPQTRSGNSNPSPPRSPSRTESSNGSSSQSGSKSKAKDRNEKK